jgi:hypothetical protein
MASAQLANSVLDNSESEHRWEASYPWYSFCAYLGGGSG